MLRFIVGILLSASFVPSLGLAAVINVPANQPAIQAAIESASDGDEIIVAAGTYNEVINFLGKAITLRSSDGPDVTTIDGTGFSDSVVKCISGEGLDTVLDGFTITGGSGIIYQGDNLGGGMLNDGSSPTILNCVFSGNIVNTTGGGAGGGMANLNGSSPTVSNCTFISNHASSGGGGMQNYPGSNPFVMNCIFDGNSAVNYGGAINNQPGASPTVVNSIFFDNVAGAGGAVTNFESNPVIINCTFGNNVAVGGGCNGCGGEGANLPRGGGLFDRGESSPMLTNCVLWDNADGGGMDESAQIHVTSGTAIVNYSCVQGWTGALGGASNIGDDPLFIDADNGDLHLSIGSSAIDSGDNSVVEVDTFDLDGDPRIQNGNVDMGAYEFNPCPTDLNFDGLVNASDLAFLLGAWGPCPDPGSCPADLNGSGDGVVSADDLAFLLGHWGACG